MAAAVKVYSWRDNARYNVQAAVFASVVEQLEEANGVATPEALVEAARPPESPIHRMFNWNDAAAAELYRADQARRALSSLRVSVRMEEGPRTEPVVAFVSVNRGESGRGYVNSQTVMADPVMRESCLEEARRALAGWRRRYQHLSELSGVFAAIDMALAEAEIEAG